jgi:hypothetical protein
MWKLRNSAKSNRFVALENLDDDVDVNTAWERGRISKLQPKIESRSLRVKAA